MYLKECLERAQMKDITFYGSFKIEEKKSMQPRYLSSETGMSFQMAKLHVEKKIKRFCYYKITKPVRTFYRKKVCFQR